MYVATCWFFLTIFIDHFVHINVHTGLFLTNMAARNKEMRTDILQSISSTYPNLISIPIPEDINEVIVGLPSATVTDNSQTDSNHKAPTPVSATLELDSIEVKNSLAKVASVVSKSSSDRFNTEDLVKEWTSLLSGANKVVH